MASALSEFERADLARIEAEIGRVDDDARKVIGRLLLEVREKRLWREGYSSFDDYVEARHRISRGKAWVVAGFADVQRDVPEIAVESHARPLISLPSEERRPAWEEAKAIAGDGRVKAKHVKEAVSAVKARPKKPGPSATSEEIDDYMRAAGIVPEGAEIHTVYHGNPEADDSGPEEPQEPTDEEWLESLPAREKLPPDVRKNFDADALLFRHASPIRLAFVEGLRPLASEAKKTTRGHIGAWLSRAYSFLQANDPSRWDACDDCNGMGRLALIGRCPRCRGEGYLL